MRHLGVAASLGLACALAGCNFAPDYRRPDTGPAAAAYKEAGPPANGQWQAAHPADELPSGAWWTLFGDPKLNALEAKVTSANQDLKAAFARFEQARASSAIARAEYYPAIGGNATINRQRLSRTTANQRPANLYSDSGLNIDLNYEIDVWGRIHNTVVAAQSQEQASAGDLASLDLSTHAELASDYFTLRGDDAQRSILDQTIDAYRKAYDLTVRRHDGGVAAEADVDQAKAQLETARTDAADITLQRQQMEHAIAILTGEPPAEFSLDAAPLTGTPPIVEPGLPSTLLERRPDVAAAERRAAAANAQIGVARAAFYPIISLSAMGGFESALPQHVFTLPSHVWSIGSNATLPIFDAGQRNAVEEQAFAAFDEAAANYRESVISAFRDVEDGLVKLHQLALENDSQQRAVDAANHALVQSRRRYADGLVTYLEVASTENTYLQAELSGATIAARRMTASVSLVKALGGGWHQEAGLDTEAVANQAAAYGMTPHW